MPDRSKSCFQEESRSDDNYAGNSINTDSDGANGATAETVQPDQKNDSNDGSFDVKLFRIFLQLVESLQRKLSMAGKGDWQTEVSVRGLRELRSKTNGVCYFVDSGDDSKDELKSEISLVHEIALKRNLSVNFEVSCTSCT